ncbi:FoF1-type ATP synthase assembly protein I [Limimonas halophila]|uniref:FoF1-type ATP synthase assembly protein I n=1 Tax=Limimonas halophila TaxID=1082479 RepID=A0A1G7KYG5_9PROT|nr:AtpZ/AtpI family protein [Limimonas halophila]SDF42161.1 FoF1-type ATP synthase assembly protein I [Limimonas halophila]
MSHKPDRDNGTDTGPVRSRDLDKRIAAAKERQHGGPRGKRGNLASSGIGFGFRLVSELVSALAVGVAIGLGLDKWLGTMPLFLIVFFVLGATAAFMNVIRLANAYDKARQQGDADPEADGGARAGRSPAGRATGDPLADGSPAGQASGDDEGSSEAPDTQGGGFDHRRDQEG